MSIFSLIPNHCIVVQISLVLLILLAYIIFWRKLRSIQNWWTHVYRECFIVFGFLLYLHALIYGDYEFYGMQDSPLCYVEICFITILVCELAVWSWYVMQNKRRVDNRNRFEKELENVPGFYEDSPRVDDELERHPQAMQLVKMIKKTALQKNCSNAFSILVSEPYGFGKTSFLCDIRSLAKSEDIPYVWIRPWNIDNNVMIANFISSLAEIYGDIDCEISSKIQKYASLFKENPYGAILYNLLNSKSIKTIESRCAEICKYLRKQRCPIIVFVDDVDRLQYHELMSVLGLIRNTVNFPYIYYIVACDKVAASRTLAANGIQHPDEYLKKFFNFELLFVANDKLVLRHFKHILQNELLHLCKNSILEPKIVDAIDDLCRREYFKTTIQHLRDVKRYANIVTFSLAMMKQNNMLDEICLPDLLTLLLVQYLNSDIYRILRDHSYILLDVEHNMLHLRKEAMDMFLSRNQEDEIEKLAQKYARQSDTSISSKPKLDKDCLTGANFVHALNVLQPTEAEQVGSLLQHLFSASSKHNGISNPCDYFKYFADKYKQCEVSDSQVEQLMQMTICNFKEEASQYITLERFPSFNNKLMHFLYYNVSYNRVDVLKKLNVLRNILESNEKEFYIYEDYLDYWIRRVCSYKFYKDEDNNAYEQEMEQLSDWLMNESDWTYIIIFCAAIQSGEDGMLLIFREDWNKLLHAVQRHFFADKMFNEDLSNAEILNRWNAVMNYDQRNFKQLLEQNLSNMTDPKGLYYRAVYLDGNAWKVNEQYCNYTNIYLKLVARDLPMLADKVLPDSECEDLLSLRSIYPILNNTKEQERHPFLKSAAKWWNAHPEEKEKMAWMVK